MHRFILHIALFLLLLSPLSVVAQQLADMGGNDVPASTVEAKLITNQVELFPNPVVSHLFIEIYHSDLKNPTFELHNIIGNEFDIEVEELGPMKYRISMEAMGAGYYFLVVQDESTRFKQAYKFLKK